MIRPRRLRVGDTVAAVSLSWGGPGTFPQRYQVGKRQLIDTFGLRVVEMPHALAEAAWLAKHPEARAEDLMEAFLTPSIAGVISTIGGGDSVRLIPHVDLDVIRANPKVFLGYSDTTVAHLLCFQAGLTSFYGPAIMSGFAENGGMFPYMVDAVRRTLFSSEPVGRVVPNSDGWTVERLEWSVPEHQHRRRQLTPADGCRFLQGVGVARGRLFGGCLDVLGRLRGTPVWPDNTALDGAILFLETSEEAPPPQVVARELRGDGRAATVGGHSLRPAGRPGTRRAVQRIRSSHSRRRRRGRGTDTHKFGVSRQREPDTA